MFDRNYNYGIYKYVDKETGNIVYIGKDSHIDKNQRHKEHLTKSHYNHQQFNKVLQNHPDRYAYEVWYHVNSIDELNQLEFDLINLYRPKFNFHHGGTSKLIDKKFEYTVTCYGKDANGKQKYAINDVNQKPLLQSIDYEYLLEIAFKLNNNEISPEDARKLKRTKEFSLQDKFNASRSKNNSGFYGVSKHKCLSCKDGVIWSYAHVNEFRDRMRIEKVHFFDLKKEVEERGLPWKIIDIDKAVQTVRSIHTGF